MEDGAKEDPAQCKESKFLGKAGWVKKAPGRLLASYKDRYIHVEKTEMVVYENEDLQNCLERLDLENYDKCHELKSPFKKKHRLILIRSPKSGNKVQDVKFQAQTAEEKEAWIKALSDGINRAKNKIFDELRTDDSSNLEHVTRTRPKGNRNRRPPTRIHMKEVAVMSSDGILRLDLDLENALMPNGTNHASVDGTEAPKEAIQVSKPPSNASEATQKHSGPSSEEEAQTEPEVSPQKKVIKPPMPPTKEAKPSATPEDEPDDGLVKEVAKPPMPPSKEAKPCVSSVEEATEKAKAEKMSEKSPDARKKTGPPPTPPNKPSLSSSMSNLTEASQSRPNSHPPTPPSKEKKPSHQAVEPDKEEQGTTDEKKGEEDSKKEAKETAVETNEAEQSDSKEALPNTRDDEPESSGAQVQISEEESEEIISKSCDSEPQAPTTPPRKSPSPLPIPERKPEELVQPSKQNINDKTTITHPTEGQDPTALLQTASDTSATSPKAEEALAKSDVPSVVVSLNEPATESLSLSPLLCQLHVEKKKKEEEKSVDSGQHSDNDSEGSGSEDTLAVSTAALKGSHAGLDVLDASEDDVQISIDLRPTQSATKSQVRSESFPCQRSELTLALKPSAKARSASSEDLLSDSSVCVQVGQHTRVAAGNDGAPGDDVMKLEAEVALEMEKTSELLNRVSQAHSGGDGEGAPKDLLTKALEKLEKAEHVLREVKKLKPAQNSSNRKSW